MPGTLAWIQSPKIGQVNNNAFKGKVVILADERRTGEWFSVTPERAMEAVEQAMVEIDPPLVDPNDTREAVAEYGLNMLLDASLCLGEAQRDILSMGFRRSASVNDKLTIIGLLHNAIASIQAVEDDDI